MRVADPAGRGVIAAGAFEHSLQVIGVSLPPSLMKALIRRFSSHGGVDYNAFAMMVEAGPSMTTLDFKDDDIPLTDSEREALRLRASAPVEECFRRYGEVEAGPVLLSCYRHYDFRGLGVVGLSEFVTASLRAGFALTRRELLALARGFLACDNFDNKLNLCVASTNAVHYQRFLGWVTPASALDFGNKTTKTPASEVEDMLKEIRQRLQIARKEADIFRRFHDADVRGTGFVDGHKLDGLLSSLPISTIEAAHLRKMFDVNRDGSFNHVEFSRFVEAGQPDGDHKPSFEVRVKELLLKCVKRGVDYRALLDRQDKDGTGVMSKNDFRLVNSFFNSFHYLVPFNSFFFLSTTS